MSHSSLSVALLASHPPRGSLWAAPKAPLGPRFPSGQFAALTRRKRASIAHFDGRARNVARNGVGQLSPAFGVRSCSPFPPSKWAGLFPSAAYRRSAPPQLALGRLKQRCLGCYIMAWMASQHRKTGLFFLCRWQYPYTNNVAWDAWEQFEYFCNAKASVVSNPRWPFQRAMRPVAEWRSF